MALREESEREMNRIIADSSFAQEVLTLDGILSLADRLRSGTDRDIQARWWCFKRKNKDGSEETFIGGSKD